MKLWVVSQVKSWSPDGWAQDWELGGVFTTERGAWDACRRVDDSYWPVIADEFLGTKLTAPAGSVFPHGTSYSA